MRTVPLLLAVAAGLALGAGVAAADPAPAFPPGWTVGPPPPPDQGSAPAGQGGWLAIRLGDDHRLAAAVELITAEPTEIGTPLPRNLAQAEQGAAEVYTRHGLTVDWDPARPATVDGHAGVSADGYVRRGGAVLVHQVMVMWAGPARLNTLSYTAPAAAFDANRAVFDQVLATLHVP